MKMKFKRQPPSNNHVCQFYKTNKSLQVLFPPELKFGKFRRKLRELLLISEENGRKSCTPKGRAGYLFEKEKHLTQHYYMIHPYSKFREYWEIMIVLEIVLELMTRTFLVSQMREEVLHSIYYQTIGFFCDLLELLDVTLVRFLTGYYDIETRTVSLEAQKVFFYHIKQFFFPLSVLSSFPLEFTIYICSVNLDSYPIFKFVIFIKILKLIDMFRYMRHISKIYNWSELTVRGVWVSASMLITCHWLATLAYVILLGDEFGKSTNKFEKSYNYFYRHFALFYLVTTIFYCQNGISSHFEISSDKDTLFSSFLTIVSFLSNTLLLSILIQILGLPNTSYIQYEEMIQEVHKFLIQENLPKHVHKKVIKYFEFRFRYKYFREKIILNTLSPPLRQEIANFLCMNLILNANSVFKNIPSDITSALCLKLKFEVFLTGDIIMRVGKEAKKMFFISCGSVGLYSDSGTEILHLYEGQHFGVASLSTTYRNYITTAIALETSELYVLRYRDFLTCIDDYPEYRSKIENSANEQVYFNLKLMEANMKL